MNFEEKEKIKPWCQQEFADLWEKNNRKLKNQQELTQHQLVFLDLHDLYGWLFGKKINMSKNTTLLKMKKNQSYIPDMMCKIL